MRFSFRNLLLSLGLTYLGVGLAPSFGAVPDKLETLLYGSDKVIRGVCFLNSKSAIYAEVGNTQISAEIYDPQLISSIEVLGERYRVLFRWMSRTGENLRDTEYIRMPKPRISTIDFIITDGCGDVTREKFALNYNVQKT